MPDNKVEGEEQIKDFLGKYQKLIEETGYKIVVNPAWKLNEKGTFEMVLQTSVGKVSKPSPIITK